MVRLFIFTLTVIFFSPLIYSQILPETAISSDTFVHVNKIEEIKYTSGDFEIAGSLYLPNNVKKKYPLVIWVSGSGPSFRIVKNKGTIRLINCFLDKGIAYFRIDKPGSGDSKGKLNDDSLFAQLSDIVCNAVKILKKQSLIDPLKIGLFGSSQAGYIMPLIISKNNDISFMIGSSCPGENSIEQWNYLLERQMLCEGFSGVKAKKNIEMFSILRRTEDKKLFDDAIHYFDVNPMIVKAVGYDSGFSKGARNWWPREINFNDESFFNPVSLIEKINIPLYLVYGGKDTQIDPFQAIDAYQTAIKKSGIKFYKIVLLKKSDHNMCISGGCLKDIEQMNKNGNYKFDPEYFDTIRSWIDEILYLLKTKK